MNIAKSTSCELLKVLQLAELIGIPASTIRRMRTKGMFPAPLKLGKTTAWRRAEVLAWIAAGSPSREAWESSPEFSTWKPVEK
jgi:predicted DNA-binding transcriptional regulator AlpA